MPVSLQRRVVHESPGELLHLGRVGAVDGVVSSVRGVAVTDVPRLGIRCVPSRGTFAETNFRGLSLTMKVESGQATIQREQRPELFQSWCCCWGWLVVVVGCDVVSEGGREEESAPWRVQGHEVRRRADRFSCTTSPTNNITHHHHNHNDYHQ